MRLAPTLCALLLAAYAGATEVVVRPIAPVTVPMGAAGAELAAAASVGLPAPRLLPSILGSVSVKPAGVRPAGLIALSGFTAGPTLQLAQRTAVRATALAGSDSGVSEELGTAFEASRRLPPGPETGAGAEPLIRPLSTVQRLRFGTYNMLNLFEKVGKHVPDPDNPGKLKRVSDKIPKEEWQLREQARAILESDLDVMSVQEVENAAALKDFVDRYLGGRYRLFLIEGNDERGIDVGFLVKSDLPLEFEHLTNKEETWRDPMLGGRETRLFSRDLPALIVKARGNPKPLFILLGTHYKSKRDRGARDKESRGLRRAQVERTAQIIGRLKAKYGKDAPILLAGDFNGQMNHEPEFEALRRIGMIDSLDALPDPPSERERVTHTYHPKGGATQAHQMDAVMIVPWMRSLVTRAYVHRYRDDRGRERPIPRTLDERSRNPSDHFLVVAELEFQPLLQRVLPASPLAASR